MGNRKISSDLKECALRLWNAGWDIEDIYNALGVFRASIYRW
jgi:transposase-like protein